MGALLDRIKALVTPASVNEPIPLVRAKPLYEQHQRIGGGVTPTQVSQILREADGGQPARLVELFNESRQKDGHLQGICSTRDGAVALCELGFLLPEKHDDRAELGRTLCQRVVDEFDNWPTLVEHLTSAYLYGHATSQVLWRKTADGYVLPYRSEPIDQRSFAFGQQSGKLLYVPSAGAQNGFDLLAEAPGRIVQIQRRIVGDVPVREGLARVLVWAALFRNWDLRDWLALGEVGWKPWVYTTYPEGAHKDQIDDLVRMLERIGSTGRGAVPKDVEVHVEWPKGFGNQQTHKEFFSTLGYEMSKAVLGQTTSTEVAGPHGDRSSTQTRDQIRLDIRERDAIATASVLRQQLFRYVVELNVGPDAVAAVPWFQTDESVDQVSFADAVQKLSAAGCRIPAKWVRDEMGMPEPQDGDELLDAPKTNAPQEPPPPANP